jgi:polygalacturonase
MQLVAASLLLQLVAATPRQFDITDFGAKPDGTTLATEAIQRSVRAASAAVTPPALTAEVVVPAGRFLTGAFSLATGVYLRLERDGVLLASTVVAAYPKPGWNWDPALVDTHNASRTGIIGEGAIDGQAPGLDGWLGHSDWIDHYDPLNNFLRAKTCA